MVRYTSWLVGSSGLAWVCLSGCTPASSSSLEWTVANSTTDTLRVSVRYPLDSTLLATPEQLASVRQRWREDSSALQGLGYHRQPLRGLRFHPPHWYLVYSRVDGVNGIQYTPAGALGSYAQVDRPKGQLTYTLPPHTTQKLLDDGYAPADGLPPRREAYMTDLWLTQNSTKRIILPGMTLGEVFKVARTGKEHAYNSLHRIQLTVGPGLTITEP